MKISCPAVELEMITSSITVRISFGNPVYKRIRNERRPPTKAERAPKNFDPATKYHVSGVFLASRPRMKPVSVEI